MGSAVAFSAEGVTVQSASQMPHALEYSLLVGRPASDHAEDLAVGNGGATNEGPLATRPGLKGVPQQAEEVAVARDLALAQLTGQWHLAYVSTARSVDQVCRAKETGIKVTPVRVNPPLRGSVLITICQGSVVRRDGV